MADTKNQFGQPLGTPMPYWQARPAPPRTPLDGRYCRLEALSAQKHAAALQRTAAATEAMYLMMRRAFEELGYRRYEWKCDSRNAPSRRAAKRLGFRYEGVFRNALVMKGRNRDTAWFSITDEEWPEVRAALEQWLDPSNFDGDGCQRQPLRRVEGR
jgi:hypothetical protein